jgi:Viral BACON domain
MNTTRCPICNNPLSESAQNCADCDGAIAVSEREVTQAERSQGKRRETAVLAHAPQHADTLKLPHLDLLGSDSGDTPSDSVTNETPPELVATKRQARSSVQTTPSKKERRRSGSRRPVDDDWSVLDLPATWHKEVAPSPNRSKATPLPPRPVRSRVRMLSAQQGDSWLRKLPPALYMWVSVLVLLIVVFSGLFGLVVTRGKDIDKAARTTELSLQVSPSSVSVGATAILKGVNFSPYGNISLSRDNSIPIVDTGDASMTDADGQGNFSDTVAIAPDWGSGQHTINAEDAARHKVASFSILVTGHATSLRPAHLFVSANSLDLGTGDQLTNTVKTLTLEDVGGGQISWQGNSTQPWLVLSPSSGTFASGQSAQVNVAIDRSKMQPGHYKAQIDLLSNAGQSTIAATAEVTRLLPGHMAMLQLSSAVLSFTGTDGGASPATQTVTISNPGQQQLQWQARSNASWLYALQQAASIAPSGSMSVPIGVNTENLLPGTYSGVVTFSARALGSPQMLQVTVTVVPQCALQFSPGILSFAGEYHGLAPAPQTITLGTYANCGAPLAWHAASNAKWLTLSSGSGIAPARPVIGINSANLKPGVYMSSILFSSKAGTQTFPVIFTLGQVTGPLVTTTPGALAFNATGGQVGPALQRVSLFNNGSGGSLTWRATAANGGSWLAVSPAGGHLAPHQSAALNINVRGLSTLPSGTYRSTITITGVDGVGAQVLGSPRTIPVSLVVKSNCAIAATPNGLSFTRTLGLTGHVSQPVTILANTTCTDPLRWSTTAVTSSGGNWLAATAAGSAGSKSNGKIAVRVTSSALGVGIYSGKVIVTATDTITKQIVGQPRVVPVALTVHGAPPPACTLQMPSASQENFTTYSGSSPTVQSFTISAGGGCGSTITITSSVRYISRSGWLTASPGSSSVSVGGAAAFTVNVASAALPTGTYTAYISLTAKDNGTALLNSPRTVKVVLNVLKRPTVRPPPPTPQPTPTPPPKIAPTPSPTPSPVPTASPTPSPTPTSTTAQADATAEATPSPTSTSTTTQADVSAQTTPLPPK